MSCLSTLVKAALVVPTVVGVLMGRASAQSPQAEQPAGVCFEIIAAQAGTEPGSAMLLNRCSGQTWLLLKIYQAATRRFVYRWSPLGSATSETAPPSGRGSPEFTKPTDGKCFTFQGRQFC
jgi:hypothetical protein